MCAAAGAGISAPAFAWGDEGHEIIGLIAEHDLAPGVRERVRTLLAEDRSGLTATDIAHESTWADKFRDSDRNTSQTRYLQTRNWHFVDLELSGADLTRACFGRARLPLGTAASAGPARACIIDKIDQFYAELSDQRTDAQEVRLALQFLLHLVGDVHQPLHAADDEDQGGNRKFVSGAGLAPSPLHHAWDTEFVERLGANPAEIAQRLIGRIDAAQRARWSQGSPDDWALESFAVARAHAYGALPAAYAPNRYELPPAYLDAAEGVCAEQLSKAGVRLAVLLNRALGPRP